MMMNCGVPKVRQWTPQHKLIVCVFKGHCITKKKQPAGFVGPKSVFHRCHNPEDPAGAEVTPTAWGVNAGYAFFYI